MERGYLLDKLIVPALLNTFHSDAIAKI